VASNAVKTIHFLSFRTALLC